MKSIFGEKITFIYFLTVSSLLFVLAIFYYNNQKVKSTSDLVEHTEEVLRMSDNVLLDITNIESGFRGYILSGNNIFLDSYVSSVKTLHKNIRDLAFLTQDNRIQQIRIDSLYKMSGERLYFTKKTIDVRKQNQMDEIEKVFTIEKGKMLSDKIRNIIVAINSEEFRLLQERKLENGKNNSYTGLIFILLLVFIMIIFALVIILINNQKTRNRDLEEYNESQKILSNYSLSLIEASLDPLITISPEGKITDMNEALVRITGLTRRQLTGTDFFDYFTEPQKAREVYQEVFSKGYVTDSPLTLRHLNGKLTDVLFNGSVYKDDQGNVLGVVIVARDIAEQKWATDLRYANKELAFQNDEKEKRAAELVIANNELAFQNDEKEKRAAELVIANRELAFQNKEKEKRAAELVIANEELAFQNEVKEQRAAELVIANKELAYQNEEKEKRASELILANEELAYQNEVKEKRAAELVVANKELAFQNNEKEKRAAELVIANHELAFQNEVKEKRAAELVLANKELAFQNDEKEKRAAELIIADKELLFQIKQKEKQEIENIELEAITESLKLASQYSLSLIEASRDPLVTINPEGKITDMNEATVNITGMTREKLTGTDFLDYFTEPDKARKVYQEVFAKGSMADAPLTIRHKDGKLTDVLFNGSVYKDGTGNVLGVVVVARDITDQKRVATELMEAIVFAELAVAIAEEAKIKAESATLIAETAVKAKQQFLSNMSHEIRTPMNAIIGFTKVLLKTDTSIKQKEYLQAIKMSGDALIVLINDILDLAKVDAGKMIFEQTPFKMAASISAMLHLFEPKIREKNLELIKEFDNNIPGVLLGDSVRLHQIILNLLSNAVKFTSKGKITVSVRLLNEDEKYVTIGFSVKDTGIGIPDNKLAKIFDNFQQASSGTSRLYGGTGLGLAIVKQLVEAQEGTISVNSKVGEGSTFGFILSFQKTKADAELEAEMVELDPELKNISVLVVEDIALNQLLMRTLLDEFGFGCEIASNGRIAVEKLQTRSFDIILMDLQMPEMNGFEATDYIRNTMHSNIPIIALTADVTTVDLAKCKSVGMDDYIAKPVDEQLLYSKILGFLKKTSFIASTVEDGNPKVPVLKYTDLDYLIRRTKGNPILMEEMISLYLEQTPPLITAMKLSWREKDWSSLYAAVHKMIPSFAIMGISTDFEEMAKKVQEYAKNQQHSDGISGMVLEIENVCGHACKELEVELDTIKNTKR